MTMNTKRPQLEKVDHLHVYAQDKIVAQRWYEEILGFRKLEKYKVWADEGGPIVVGTPNSEIELAIFARDGFQASSIIAFGVRGQAFLAWKTYLEQKELLAACKDHGLTWSLYFNDPDGNGLEITTHDYDYIQEYLDME